MNDSEYDHTKAYGKSHRKSDFFTKGAGEPLPEAIGRFQIQRLLGEGGFASVYQAYDPSLDRQVAIKIPHASLRREFLRREARMAARLKHPAIVQIYEILPSISSLPDSSPTETDPLVYVVMQYVEGTNLGLKMEQQKLSLDWIVNLMVDVVEAVGFAHAQGVLHRDLKPQNVLLDKQDRPYVTDFGLAVREETVDQHLGEYCGTPAYMSPEQTKGHSPAPTADIWSIGVILYEALTRERPFGSHPLEVMERLEKSLPAPPRSVDSTIPLELERICLKCLQKDPADRYQSCDELLADLKKWKVHRTTGPSEEDIQKAEQTYKQAFANVDAGDLPTAIDQLYRVIKLNPDSAQGHYLLGMAYLMSDAPVEQAVPPLTRAIELNPDNHAASFALAQIYYAVKAYPMAIRFADRALEAQPANQRYREFQKQSRKHGSSTASKESQSSEEIVFELQPTQRRTLCEVAESIFEAEKTRRLTLKHWITDHYPWRLIRPRPLLGSILFASLSYLAVIGILLLDWRTDAAIRLGVVWLLNWLLLYGPYFIARRMESTYLRLLPVVNVPEDVFRRFFVREAGHVLGGTCGMTEAPGQGSWLSAWKHNRAQLLVAIVFIIPIAIFQVYCGNLQGASPAAYAVALYYSGGLQTIFALWVCPFAFLAMRFIPRFYNVPVRYFLGMPVELSLAAIGKFYIRCGWIFGWGILIGLIQHYVFRTFDRVPVISSLYVGLFMIGGGAGIIITQYQLYALLRRLKARRILEYSYHLESAFEQVMRKPNQKSFDELRSHRAFMKELKKLNTRGLTNEDLLQFFLILTLASGAMAIYWYLVLQGIWLV